MEIQYSYYQASETQGKKSNKITNNNTFMVKHIQSPQTIRLLQTSSFLTKLFKIQKAKFCGKIKN